jgi:hypothetical protein
MPIFQLFLREDFIYKLHHPPTSHQQGQFGQYLLEGTVKQPLHNEDSVQNIPHGQKNIHRHEDKPTTCFKL